MQRSDSTDPVAKDKHLHFFACHGFHWNALSHPPKTLFNPIGDINAPIEAEAEVPLVVRPSLPAAVARQPLPWRREMLGPHDARRLWSTRRKRPAAVFLDEDHMKRLAQEAPVCTLRLLMCSLQSNMY